MAKHREKRRDERPGETRAVSIPGASSACPICGSDTPHHHDADEVGRYHAIGLGPVLEVIHPDPAPLPGAAEELQDVRFARIFERCAELCAGRGMGHEAARLHEAQICLDEFRAKLPAAVDALTALGMPPEFIADLERMRAVL
jgi:hypothetical protein